MWGAIPCPPDLIPQFIHRRGKEFKDCQGLWLLTEDAKLISQHIASTIDGNSPEAIAEQLDMQFKSPPDCTQVFKYKTSPYDLKYTHNTGLGNSESWKSFVDKLTSKDGYVHYLVGLPHRAFTPDAARELTNVSGKLDTTAFFAEAKSSSTHAVYLPHEVVKQLPKEWQEASNTNGKAVIIDKQYVLEYTSFGLKLTYDLKRASRIAKRRSRIAKGETLVPLYTAYQCMVQIVKTFADNLWTQALWQLGHSNWSTAGIHSCAWTVVHFVALAKLLRKQRSMRKLYAVWLKRLYFQQSAMRKYATGEFLDWYDKEMKLIGIPNPKLKRRYMVRQKVTPN